MRNLHYLRSCLDVNVSSVCTILNRFDNHISYSRHNLSLGQITVITNLGGNGKLSNLLFGNINPGFAPARSKLTSETLKSKTIK